MTRTCLFAGSDEILVLIGVVVENAQTMKCTKECTVDFVDDYHRVDYR